MYNTGIFNFFYDFHAFGGPFKNHILKPVLKYMLDEGAKHGYFNEKRKVGNIVALKQLIGCPLPVYIAH